MHINTQYVYHVVSFSSLIYAQSQTSFNLTLKRRLDSHMNVKVGIQGYCHLFDKGWFPVSINRCYFFFSPFHGIFLFVCLYFAFSWLFFAFSWLFSPFHGIFFVCLFVFRLFMAFFFSLRSSFLWLFLFCFGNIWKISFSKSVGLD